MLAFLTFRPEQLHRLDTAQPAWPSPRAWEMAARLHRAGLDVSPAIGEGAGSEFAAFVRLYEQLPDLETVLRGDSVSLRLPAEPSVRYAAVVGLAARAQDAQEGFHAFSWLADQATPEWLQLYVATLVSKFQATGQLGELVGLMGREPRLAELIQGAVELAEG